MSNFIRYVPNILTILRLAAVPFFAWLMLQSRMTEAMWLFVFAEATDALDGFIARKYKVVSVFGRIADPIADKLIQLTALFMLDWKNMIPSAIPWLFLLKELIMVVASVFAIRKKMDTSAKWYGKLTSASLFMAIMVTFFLRGSSVSALLLWACAVLTLFSLVMYGRNYILMRRKFEL